MNRRELTSLFKVRIADLNDDWVSRPRRFDNAPGYFDISRLRNLKLSQLCERFMLVSSILRRSSDSSRASESRSVPLREPARLEARRRRSRCAADGRRGTRAAD